MKKKLLYALVAVMLTAGAFQAVAGWNIQQREEGGAAWVDQDGNSVGVGDTGLVVRITDLSTASTHYTVSPRAGRITRVYAISQGTSTGSAAGFTSNSELPIITIGVEARASSDFTFVPISAGATISMTTNPAAQLNSVVPFRGAAANRVSAGAVISVHTGGESTGTVVGIITIIIE